MASAVVAPEISIIQRMRRMELALRRVRTR